MSFVPGILRLALAATVVLLLAVSQGSSWLTGAYLATGISIVFGALFVAGRPKSLRHRPLAGVLIDVLAITLLVASTGGKGSLFSSLYFLAALGLVWVRGTVRLSIGIAALLLGCVISIAAPDWSLEPLLSSTAAFKSGLLVVFGAAAALGGISIRAIRQEGDGSVSALAAERRYVKEADSIASHVGPVLATLSVEERLSWTVETVRDALEAPYAHATTSDGAFHQTAVQGGKDAYPGWWHPEIQRLVLWSCRTGEIVHSDAGILGTEGFVTVPLVARNGGGVGAIVAGGRYFDAEDERALRLLADQVASALADAGEAPGGIDSVSGLPNQDSLERVVRREMYLERPFALVLVGLDFSGRSLRDLGFLDRDSVLRSVGQRLKEANHRAFRCADGTFAVLPREVSSIKTRAVAVRIRHVAEEAVNSLSGLPAVSTAASFVVSGREAGRWQEGLAPLLDAARAALGEAQDQPDRVSEALMASDAPASEPGALIGESRTSPIVKALEEAVEVRDPDLAEHSRAVSRMALLIGTRMALPAEQIEALAVGGLLHDIGKIGLPDSILNKPSALSAEEYEIVKQHPVLGAGILDTIPELSSVALVVRHHHERFDGRGYPKGLRGEHVPLPARIISVADAFDSMTRDRVYRAGRDKDSALEVIIHNSGTQFDPEVVEVLRQIIAESESRRASL